MKIRQTNYLRYKIFEVEKELYLIDIDSNIFCWLFPFWLWNLSFKAQKISYNELNTLEKRKDRKTKKTNRVALSLGTIIIGSILGTMIGRLFGGRLLPLVYVGNNRSTLLLALLVILLFLIKFAYSQIERKNLKKENIQLLGMISMKSHRTNSTQYRGALYTFALFIATVLFFYLLGVAFLIIILFLMACYFIIWGTNIKTIPQEDVLIIDFTYKE